MIEKQPKRNLLPAQVIYATGLIDYVFMTPRLKKQCTNNGRRDGC